MAKKKYELTRAKIASRLQELSDRLTELDVNDTSPNELDAFLTDVSNDIADLCDEVTNEAD